MNDDIVKKLRFDDALEMLVKSNEELYKRLKMPIGEAPNHDMNKCQNCLYCAYWRLRQLVWSFYDIRYNITTSYRHIDQLYD